MVEKPDYSLLDGLGLFEFVFFPRKDWTPPPPDAADHLVPVDEAVSISCRCYPAGKACPSILYFHGNGEVACEHDWIAPLYNRIGVNLFVADYRGYGRSGGRPTFSNTVADSHIIFECFLSTLESAGYVQSVFVMGRSLGSISAIELASSYPEILKGLILESGSARASRLLRYIEGPLEIPGLDGFERACLEAIRRITMPSLIIHGEQDMVIPYDHAVFSYENIGSGDKKLLTIPHAGHNDILLVGMEEYFEAIGDFVVDKSGTEGG